jgi:hypothetical protein
VTEKRTVVVILRREAAVAMRDGPDGGDASLGELKAIIFALGAEIDPQFQTDKDSDLGRYFVVQSVPAGRAEELVERLQALGAVESAYVQPSPVLP